LNDATALLPGELRYPFGQPSQAGDFVMVSQSATVLGVARAEIRFREQDDYTGTTAGYHFKQLLVDGEVAWEADVAGGTLAAQEVVVDVTRLVGEKRSVTIAFRLLDKKDVGNFGVTWSVRDLRVAGLQLANDVTRRNSWPVTRQGRFETNFGPAERKPERRFHLPLVVMMAGSAAEFRIQRGDPATPERIAESLRMPLGAWRDGKCAGLVTFCLDKRPGSEAYELVRKLYREFGKR
jgi:hypothetical protein